ncbi:hypothetical protein BCEP4_1150021 [Burkholderia cepacia]|nr:hypothetical protein BCEP4_1150021 [Burkholderia cepacia]
MRDRRRSAQGMGEVPPRDAASPGSAAQGVRDARHGPRCAVARTQRGRGHRQGAGPGDRAGAEAGRSGRRAGRRGGMRGARRDQGPPELGADRLRGRPVVGRCGEDIEGRARRGRGRRGSPPVSHARLGARDVDRLDGLQGRAAAAGGSEEGRIGGGGGARRTLARQDDVTLDLSGQPFARLPGCPRDVSPVADATVS